MKRYILVMILSLLNWKGIGAMAIPPRSDIEQIEPVNAKSKLPTKKAGKKTKKDTQAKNQHLAKPLVVFLNPLFSQLHFLKPRLEMPADSAGA